MADDTAAVEYASSNSATNPRPRIVNPNLHTIDISKKFRVATSTLLAGTLIKDEHFTLFESVGALEIGDPKMDSGCVEDGESLEDDFDVCKLLSPTELIWLMDELLSREVAWHVGYPLSQTLFTSVYIEKLLWPNPIRLHEAQFSKRSIIQSADPMLHRLFRSYCLGLVKSCDLVLRMVTSQHYYEEEDFATQLYNRELLHRFAVEDVLADMEHAMRYLSETNLDTATKASLEARLNFRFSMLSMLSSHTGASSSLSSTITGDRSLLTRIQKSRHQGVPVPDAFTLKIQRRLASTVPPRPMVSIDEGRTFEYLTRFIRDCQQASSVLCASHPQDLLTSYSIFCSQAPQPSVYVRALLQSWLSQDNLIAGMLNEYEFVFSDMLSVTLAASPVAQASYLYTEFMTGDQKLVKQHLQEFVGKNGRSFLNIWRTTCLNRCRVRRTMCHAAVEWDQIQAEAEDLDDELQRLTNEQAIEYPMGAAPTFSYSLSSWIYHYKLIQLRHIVQSGFELEVYAQHELAGMYWFLAHLCESHLTHLERISFFISRREAALPPTSRRSVHDSRKADECQASLRHLYRQFSWVKATEAAARALHGLYTVLQRHGTFQQRPNTYASDHLRYELRMRPFLHLSIPEPISFETYRRRTQMEVRSDMEILEESVSYASIAKKGWEEVLRTEWHTFPLRTNMNAESASAIRDLWTTDVRGAFKAAIGISVAITRLEKRLRTGDGVRFVQGSVDVPHAEDKDYWHAWWLVPRLSF